MQDVSFWCCSVWTLGFWIFCREKLDILSNFRQAFLTGAPRAVRIVWPQLVSTGFPDQSSFCAHVLLFPSFYFSGVCNQVPRNLEGYAAFEHFRALPLEYRAEWMPSFAYFTTDRQITISLKAWILKSEFFILAAFKKKEEEKIAVRSYCCILAI